MNGLENAPLEEFEPIAVVRNEDSRDDLVGPALLTADAVEKALSGMELSRRHEQRDRRKQHEANNRKKQEEMRQEEKKGKKEKQEGQ